MEEWGVASSNDHDIRTVPMPDVDEMRAMIRTAAARASQPIREAIDKGLDKYELFAWWGAQAGAPYLPKPVTVQTAIAQSLQLLREDQAACPKQLPSLGRVLELSKMLDMLDGVAH